MGELINGRTPEEIKDGLKHCIEPVPYGCEVCPYNETCLEHAPEIDALALIEHLEAKVPKWISVEEREPEFPCICYDGVNAISIPKSIASLTLKNGKKVFVSDAFDAFLEAFPHVPPEKLDDCTHILYWMQLPEPPEEGLE